eukprot:TRINITY_DN10939_c0_g1_i1.p1 TRINITY_DN10939_c0_g1~~TRINITY_DN10939_c0_g1_i1.p1  ORF type:complete len:194 (-),score=60.98 TRINITY_DN10939_c0_g1_i1:58-615(-)
MEQQNFVNIDEVIEKLNNNDSSLTKLNLNSHLVKRGEETEEPKPEHAIAIAKALVNNTHLLDLQLANSKVNTEAAKELANALRVNKSLSVLNLETNDITGEGILALVEALKENDTLTELKLTNQLKIIPSDVERALGPALEGNTSLVKFVATLREQSCRNAVDKVIFRNKDIARKKRVDAAKGKK